MSLVGKHRIFCNFSIGVGIWSPIFDMGKLDFDFIREPEN